MINQDIPRPLSIKHDLGMITVSDANGKTCFSWHSYKENIELANLMVQAVNYHDELVASLKNVIKNYEECLNNDKIYVNPNSNHSINIAKQALSKAEGKES